MTHGKDTDSLLSTLWADHCCLETLQILPIQWSDPDSCLCPAGDSGGCS